MGRNGNRLHGNGREWECKKPFPGISSCEPRIDGKVRLYVPPNTCVRENNNNDSYTQVLLVCYSRYGYSKATPATDVGR